MPAMNNFIGEETNINLYPNIADECYKLRHPNQQLTIGDLHANPIKLLYSLIRHGLVSMNPNHYLQFCRLYQRACPLTPQIYAEYLVLLSQIKWTPGAAGRVTLIGDELADRGQNDVLMLELLNRMAELGINYEILLSNHGVEFVHSYETGRGFNQTILNNTRRKVAGGAGKLARIYKVAQDNPSLGDSAEVGDLGPINLADTLPGGAQEMLRPFMFAFSMTALYQALSDKVISQERVGLLISNAYQPKLRLLSYTISEDGSAINIYSHAGVDLQVVRALALYFNLPYQDETLKKLTDTIDAINQAFAKKRDDRLIHSLCSAQTLLDSSTGLVNPNANPIEYLLWNRNHGMLERPGFHNGYAINFIHGHHLEESVGNIYGVDSELGKSLQLNQGKYNVLASRGFARYSDCEEYAAYQQAVANVQVLINDDERHQILRESGAKVVCQLKALQGKLSLMQLTQVLNYVAIGIANPQDLNHEHEQSLLAILPTSAPWLKSVLKVLLAFTVAVAVFGTVSLAMALATPASALMIAPVIAVFAKAGIIATVASGAVATLVNGYGLYELKYLNPSATLSEFWAKTKKIAAAEAAAIAPIDNETPSLYKAQRIA